MKTFGWLVCVLVLMGLQSVGEGVMISNGLPQSSPNYFAVDVGSGAGLNNGYIGQTNGVPVDFVYSYQAYYLTETNNGSSFSGDTVLSGDNRTRTTGSFAGENGTVSYTVDSYILDQDQMLFQEWRFSCAQGLGSCRFVQYLDEDVLSASDDVLIPLGTYSSSSLKLYTVDGATDIGTYQSVMKRFEENVTWVGWSADYYSDLSSDIRNGSAVYRENGYINTNNVPRIPGTSPVRYGPVDVGSAIAYDLDARATQAVLVATLGLNTQFKVYELQVNSQDPSSGMVIGVDPADNNGDGEGTTAFTREYDNGSAVTLSSERLQNGRMFDHWLVDGARTGSSNAVEVTMSTNRTVTAVFVEAPPIHVTGTVVYAGAQTGSIHVVCREDGTGTVLDELELAAPGVFVMTNVPLLSSGTIEAWRDVNGDGVQTSWEALGAYPGGVLTFTSSPAHVTITMMAPDSDGDGVYDQEELFTFHTRTNLLDSDEDTYPDGLEIDVGTNPNAEESHPPESSQPTREWSRIWGSSGADNTHNVVTGPKGDFYVAGEAGGSIDGLPYLGSNDFCLTKFDASGTRLWTRVWGTPMEETMAGLAVDSNGVVYVYGNTEGTMTGCTNQGGTDFVLTSFTEDGTVAYCRQWGSTQRDYAGGLAEQNGKLYAGGFTYGAFGGQTNSGYYDFCFSVLDLAGEVQWNRIWGSAGYEQGNAVAVDGAGSIYVGGYTMSQFDGEVNAGERDCCLTKFDASGTRQWVRIWGTPTNEYVWGMAAGNSNLVYAAGRTYGVFDAQPKPGMSDLCVSAFDVDGVRVWSRIAGGAEKDGGIGMTVGPDDSLYVVGYAWSAMDGQTNAGLSDLLVTRYSAEGRKYWTRLWGSPERDYGYAACALDAQGLVVCGYTAGAFDGQTGHGGYDMCVSRWNFSSADALSLTGAVYYGGGQTGMVYSFCYDAEGSLQSVVTGAVPGAVVFDELVQGAAYTLNGYRDVNGNRTRDDWEPYGAYAQNPLVVTGAGQTFSFTLEDPDADHDGLPDYMETGVYGTDPQGFDSDGDGYSDGAEVLAGTLPLDGASVPAPGRDPQREWSRIWGDAHENLLYGVALDSAGQANVGGRTELGSLSYAYMAQYSTAGNYNWQRTWGSDAFDFGYGVAVDAADRVYLAGYTKGNFGGQTNVQAGWSDIFLSQLSDGGSRLWDRQWGGPYSEQGRGVATGGTNALFVGGVTYEGFDGQTNNGGSADFCLSRVDGTGKREWSRIWGSSDTDEGYGVATDPSGFVGVAGMAKGAFGGQVVQGSADASLTRFDGQGNVLWSRIWGSPLLDRAYGVAADAQGNWYVAGETAGVVEGQPVAGRSDMLLTKFAADGTLLWSRTWGSAGVDSAFGVAVDSNGAVYVVGMVGGEVDGQPAVSGSSGDLVLSRFTANGTRAWTRLWGSINTDSARGVAVGSNGVVYVAGYAYGAFDGQSAYGGADFCLSKWLVPPGQDVHFTNDTVIAVTNVEYEGLNMVVDGCSVTVLGDHSFGALRVTNGTVHAEGTNLTVESELHLDDSTFNAGAELVLTVRQGLVLTNDSTLRVYSTNTQGVVDGRWRGFGGTIAASNLWVAEGCKITATGLGYVGSTNAAGMGPGGGLAVDSGAGGGGYGGAGGAGRDGASGGVSYGLTYLPREPGSGGGGDTDYSYSGSGGAGGGTIQLFVSGAARVDGSIEANGADGENSEKGGGAGGALLLDAQVLSGSGELLCAGGDGGANGGGGGGGRIAVYTWGGNSFGTNQAQVSGGSGYSNGAPGTVVFESRPLFYWTDPDDALLHGEECIGWGAVGVNPAGLAVDVSLVRSGADHSIASAQPVRGQTTWCSTNWADGSALLRAKYTRNGSTYVGGVDRDVVIVNQAEWHSGTLTTNATWSSNRVQILETLVTIPSNVTIVIQPGTVVKALDECGFVVADGGNLTATGTAEANVVLTAVADDTVGGDTLFDGDRVQPVAGCWRGITPAGPDGFAWNGYTDIRYIRTTHGGLISADETWLGNVVHCVTGDVSVASGVTLTLAPGAVVKMHRNGAMVFNTASRLLAPGTLAAPVTITSIRDDSVGGDSNGDGDQTQPAAGDWRWIYLDDASGVFDHAQVRYGGGIDGITTNWNETAMLRADGDKSYLSVSNSSVRDAYYDGFLVWYGTGVVANTVFSGCDRAVCSHPDGEVTVRNCTMVSNGVGILMHGGYLDIANTLVADSVRAGFLRDWGATSFTQQYCNLWNPAAEDGNYSGIDDQTGQNGNISGNPVFRDAGRYDFRPGYTSVCIDAANTLIAPQLDCMGTPRNRDANRPATGIAGTNGAIADIGAYEFAEHAESPIDLRITSVQGPAEVMAGDVAEVSWVVVNRGTEQAIGPWHDRIGLVRSPDAAPVLLDAGELQNDVAQLGPGQAYTNTAQIRVPGGVVGEYFWQVQANCRDEVFEGRNRTNNTTVSTGTVQLDLHELSLDQVSYSGIFSNSARTFWFKVSPTNQAALLIGLDRTSTTGATELYAAQGFMPDRETYDGKQQEWNAPDVQTLLPATTDDIGYILVIARTLPIEPDAFSIQVRELDFSIVSVEPDTVSYRGPATFKWVGGELSRDMVCELVDASGNAVSAETMFFESSSVVWPTFNLEGLAAGSYSARITLSGAVTMLQQAVTVTDDEAGHLEVLVLAPEVTRPQWVDEVTVEYRNTGYTDVPAPLLVLRVDHDARLRWNKLTNYNESAIAFLGIHSQGPAGVLPPGTSERITFGFKTGNWDIDFRVEQPKISEAMDWNAQQRALQPSYIVDAAWDAVFTNFVQSAGPNIGTFSRMLASNATYLARFRHYEPDVRELMNLEMRQADGYGMLSSRNTLGAFGWGVPDATAFRADVDDAGNVVINMGGQRAVLFYKTGENTYLNADPQDIGSLRYESGVYRWELEDGHRAVFNADRTLNYMMDSGGHRMTCEYSGGHLAAWYDEASGDRVRYAYDGNGRVITVTDPVGDVTTYRYETDGDHLTAVIGPDGATNRISWITGQGATREHAVSTLHYANGTSRTFTYDAQGRCSAVQNQAGITTATLRYHESETIISNVLGQTFTVAQDSMGAVREWVDPLGAASRTVWNIGRNGLDTLTPNKTQTSVLLDDSGRISRLVNGDGGSIAYAYGDAAHPGQPTRMCSPAGRETRYALTDDGQLASITAPDGTVRTLAYDSFGRVTNAVNGRGAGLTLTYDAAGLTTRRAWSATEYVEYFYDADRQLTSAVKRVGSTYSTNTFAYDASGRLAQVVYPNGLSLSWQYDAVGRRTRMTTGDGGVTYYEYDSNGRLYRVKDAAGQPYVTYAYDALGRVASRTYGNGATSTFTRDAAGRITQVLNKAPSSSVLSQHTYGYDANGHLIASSGPGGTNAITRDAAGRISRVVASDGSEQVFEYDRDGCRTAVIEDGVPIPYSQDALGQYIQVGDETRRFDADGNLISRSGPSGSWTYTYNNDNQLTAISGSDGTRSYEYDAMGNCIAKTVNGTRTLLLLDPLTGGTLVGEYASSGSMQARYVFGDGLIARVPPARRVDQGEAQYITPDGRNNVSELIDQNGDALNKNSYDSFQKPTAIKSDVDLPFNSFGSAGVVDMETGFVDTYDPGTGSQVASDPVPAPTIGGGEPVQMQPGPIDFNEPIIDVATGVNIFNGIYSMMYDTVSNYGNQYIRPALKNTWKAIPKIKHGLQKGGYINFKNWPSIAPKITALKNYIRSGEQALPKGVTKMSNAGSYMAYFDVLYTAYTALDNWKKAYDNYGVNEDAFAKHLADAFYYTPLIVVKSYVVATGSPYLGVVVHTGYYGVWRLFDTILNKPIYNGFYSMFDWWYQDDFSDYEYAMWWSVITRALGSYDPNDITGPTGYGAGNWIAIEQTMPYLIRFENVSTASAPAQVVSVTNALDANLDLSTFELGGFGFGNNEYDVPAGLNIYCTTVDVSAKLGVDVRFEASLDQGTGLATWKFTSLVSGTGQPTMDPYAGFLPPNTNNHCGEGFVRYLIKPKQTLHDGETIDAQAGIIFDLNEPIITTAIYHSVDTTLPTSTMQALPEQSATPFTVRWSGNDGNGAGIIGYSIYVSKDSGAYSNWLYRTAAISAAFTGEVNSVYAFYCTAIDGTGREESAPPNADTFTTVTRAGKPSLSGILILLLGN